MRSPRRLALWIAAALVGCSPSQTPLSPRAPHGGMLFDLTGVPGSVEIVRQPADGQPGRVRLLLYSLDAELRPMSPGATAATLKSRGRAATPIEFRPSGDADPARAGVLESPILPDQGDIAGELSVTIDGRPSTLSISVR